MSERLIVQLAIQLLWLVLLLSLPIVLTASVVGLLVSLFQALTQLQDQTLQFLIKLIAVSITLMATYPWMGDTLLNYTNLVFKQIVQMSP
ncbi:MAG: EscS/YscS/HrcS family type III secretion system export apparatus protein [Candidatus Symbiodolus clandestinus]